MMPKRTGTIPISVEQKCLDAGHLGGIISKLPNDLLGLR